MLAHRMPQRHSQVMQRENLRRFLFVSAACLLSFPWLTPCVGIWSAAAVDGTHNAVTHRDDPMSRLPTAQLKKWAAKEGPKLEVYQNQPIPPGMAITDTELSTANGGRTAPRPGTLVGKGASAVVDGLTYTLSWVDPFTWISNDSWRIKPSTPQRQLILREAPFVLLQGDEIRYIREGKDGPVRLAKAKNATLRIITPDGSYRIHAAAVHYHGPADEVLLEQPGGIYRSTQTLGPRNHDSWIRLNFVKRTVSCSGKLTDWRNEGIRFQFSPLFPECRTPTAVEKTRKAQQQKAR